MSNELSTGRILVCPADPRRGIAATRFATLQPSNVTYQVRSGADAEKRDPPEILVRCPIHGHVLLCDASVQMGPGRPATSNPTEAQANAGSGYAGPNGAGSAASQQATPTYGGLPVDLPRLRESLQDAPLDVQRAVGRVNYTLRYGRYAETLKSLDQLRDMPGINDAQKQVIDEVVHQVKQAAEKQGAAKAIQKSADPSLEAQYQLGLKYSRGDGVERDVILAYALLHVAAEGGHGGALIARFELSRSMTQAQITEAVKRADELKKKPAKAPSQH